MYVFQSEGFSKKVKTIFLFNTRHITPISTPTHNHIYLTFKGNKPTRRYPTFDFLGSSWSVFKRFSLLTLSTGSSQQQKKRKRLINLHYVLSPFAVGVNQESQHDMDKQIYSYVRSVFSTKCLLLLIQGLFDRN